MTGERPLLALNMIVRDGGAAFRAALASVVEQIDELVVGVDTRTVDDTKKAVWEVVPKHKHVVLFDLAWRNHFGWARQQALSRTTARTMFWMDADDVLEGEAGYLRAMAENLARADGAYDIWQIPYEYSYDENGRLAVVHERERMIRTDRGWAWRDRVHETLSLEEPYAFRPTRKIRVCHRNRGEENHAERNRHLLYLQLIDDLPEADRPPAPYDDWTVEQIEDYYHPRGGIYELSRLHSTNPRTLPYLAQTTPDPAEKEKWQRAFLEWSRHGPDRRITLPERWQALCYLGDALFLQRKLPEAAEVYLKASYAYPEWPDAWLGLADLAMAETEWEKAKFFAGIALLLIQEGKRPDPLLFTNELHYELQPHLILGHACLQLGEWEAAVQHAEAGLKVSPENPGFVEIGHAAQFNQRRNREAAGWVDAMQSLLRGEDPIRAKLLYKVVPDDLKEKVPQLTAMYRIATRQSMHLDNPEAYVAHYRNHPGWVEAPDEICTAEGWLAHPRGKGIAYAIGTDGAFRTVLDLGMADGILHPLLARLNCAIHGVDLDPRCVEVARARAERMGYDEMLTVEEGEASVVLDRLAEAGAHFDVALVGELLEHVPDPVALLALIERVARRTVLTTPDNAFDGGEAEGWDKPEPRNHVRALGLATMKELLMTRPSRRIDELYTMHADDVHGWIVAATELGQHEGPVCKIYCGPGWEPWSPRDVRWGGLGGSETAVVNVARELSAMGWNVIVYAEADGIWDGVLYRHHSEFRDGGCNLFVAWRSPQILTRFKEKLPGHVALWLHDVDCGDALNPEVASRIDSILYLSEWHKGHLLERYPWLNPMWGTTGPSEYFDNKERRPALVRTWNGIDPLDMSDVERDQHRLMWASSPDRGLDVILEHWGEIKAVWPDARLTVAYGTRTLDAMAESRPALRSFKSHLNALLREHAADIDNIGRVPWDRLRREWAKASVFLYPPPKSGFAETFCISVLEACAAGCIPIVHSGGALPETCSLVGGWVYEPEEWWASVLADLAEGTGLAHKSRETKIENARAYTWRKVADGFASLIGASQPLTAV